MQPNLKADAEVVAIQPEVGNLTSFAQSLVIKTAEGYQAAANRLMMIKSMLKKIDDAHSRVKKPILAAGRELDAQKNEASAPLKSAEIQIKRAMSDFTTEQERIRRIEQAKADEAARKQQEKLQQQAARAAASGKFEKAGQLEQRAATVVAPVIQIESPKVAGISPRETWHAECVDLKALVKAIAEGRAPLSLVMANDKVLGAQARSLKADFVCDGVRVWSEKSIAAAGAA